MVPFAIIKIKWSQKIAWTILNILKAKLPLYYYFHTFYSISIRETSKSVLKDVLKEASWATLT